MDNLNRWMDKAVEILTGVGLKLLGAVVIWVVGRKLIALARRLTVRALERQKIDATLVRYLDSTLGVVLDVILVIAILGMFGVETTTFAALMAGAGVAIGMAWSGLLSNFAAGVFMIVLRPFKVGDYVRAAGLEGTVQEIGLFVTTIHTPDNVRTFIGNSRIFGDTIVNFTANPYRRVELTDQLAHAVDVDDTIRRLKARLAQIPNVVADPAPEVTVLTFTLAGPVLAVRPYCHNDHYWQVYFDANRAMIEVGAEANHPAPEQHVRMIQQPMVN
jgi:small conductance mechanosensitive channel